LAKALFKNEHAAIEKIVYDGDATFEIIGVTNDWLGFHLHHPEPTERTVFMAHYYEQASGQCYLIKTKNKHDRTKVIEEVSKLLIKTYRNELILKITKIDDAKYQAWKSNRIYARLLLTINIALGFVVAFSISGQTLFWINQRIKQIGVRRALGASQRDIVKLLLTENIIICSIGLALGALLTLAANQIIINLHFPPIPPKYLITTCLTLLTICLVSTLIPAWRASKISPSVATRTF
jgi:putative ABC transport system permease protein